MRDRFWELPLADLDGEEWEALCDGCGKCCLHKAEDADTGRVYFSDIRCRLLDACSARCGDYANRRAHVPDCVRLTPETVGDIEWLPGTCAYRLRNEGRPLPDWHYLVCGDADAVHRAGQSTRGWTVAEEDAGDIEDHLLDRPV